MGSNSKIQWTDATFNPWIGCTKVSPACDNCYAEAQDARNRWGGLHWGKDAPRKRTSESYWRQPLSWNRKAEREGKRLRVFCGSLCDVMEHREDLSAVRGDLYTLIENTPYLDWLLLTKRPQNYRKMLPASWLEKPLHNVWGMTTVESSDYFWRIEALRETPFAIRGLSIEPLLEPMPKLHEHLDGIHWAIIGGESGPEPREFRLERAVNVMLQCRKAGVRVFMKQLGQFPTVDYYTGEDLREWALSGEYNVWNHGHIWDDRDGQPTPGASLIQIRGLHHKGSEMEEWPPFLRVRELPANARRPAAKRAKVAQARDETMGDLWST